MENGNVDDLDLGHDVLWCKKSVQMGELKPITIESLYVSAFEYQNCQK